VKAPAAVASTQDPHLGLASASRVRAALLGLALDALALAASIAGALLIASGPFHTSPGSLA
jgi:hypothetical protein